MPPARGTLAARAASFCTSCTGELVQKPARCCQPAHHTCPLYLLFPPNFLHVLYMQSFDFFTDRVWIWIGVAAMLFFYLLCNVATFLALKYYSGAQTRASVSDGRSVM